MNDSFSVNLFRDLNTKSMFARQMKEVALKRLEAISNLFALNTRGWRVGNPDNLAIDKSNKDCGTLHTRMCSKM